MANPTRLGRGLGSLIAGGSSSSNPQPHLSAKDSEKKTVSLPVKQPTLVNSSNSNELLELSLDKIVPNPHQPRKVIDSNTISELAASIESEGLLQPIVVRKSGDSYELIAGERRHRAHQKLGRTKILARIVKASDLSSASLSLIENLQREGLNPVDEANGFHSLVHDFNLTQAKVAERVGKSRVYVTNLLRILKLHHELINFLSAGKLSTGHAKVLLGVEDLNSQLEIGLRAINESWTVRQCEQAVDDYFNAGSSTNFSRIKSTNNPYSTLAQEVGLTLGRSVKIKTDSNGGGKVILNFKDDSDLRNILSSLQA